MEIDKKIDIKGEVCPYTFVKTKLALEELGSGQILEIITDHKPAVRNVTRSCENEGHEIIKNEKINETDYRLIIKRKQKLQQTLNFFCAYLHIPQNLFEICLLVSFFVAISFARALTINSILLIFLNFTELPALLPCIYCVTDPFVMYSLLAITALLNLCSLYSLNTSSLLIIGIKSHMHI